MFISLIQRLLDFWSWKTTSLLTQLVSEGGDVGVRSWSGASTKLRRWDSLSLGLDTNDWRVKSLSVYQFLRLTRKSRVNVKPRPRTLAPKIPPVELHDDSKMTMLFKQRQLRSSLSSLSCRAKTSGKWKRYAPPGAMNPHWTNTLGKHGASKKDRNQHGSD